MVKKKSKRKRSSAKSGEKGATHQTAPSVGDALTTNQGLPISDNQNTLTVGPRGPQLLEDHILREKITHFDHERIPERVVHARGYGAHGTFEAYEGNEELTKAAFLQAGVETEVFARFSTVAGSAGSPDVARDVRGFATKFYTSEGNYDLVGNNMPVFFIQDAIKFPDLIHSVKPEPDRDFPQAQSAHDTFWDFVSLTPEAVHMLMWVMSDRAIPRSLRMMEGFGVHTFRMVNAKGKVTFVKFHWRPKLGTFSVVWDEAVKINGADPDYHRRDLWGAIEKGDFPEWELSVQAFSERKANSFDFDVLDPTKLVPEELVPLRPIGRMVLNRNVDNFFAETEQAAFCPSHVVPGIDFSNDPLLQGRLFSYLDTQLSRLGSPNFHQIPINAPKSRSANFQRDAHMQMDVPKGRAAYEPNSLDDGSLREHPDGFASVPAGEEGQKLRVRPESFADHYTQARQFWTSMTDVEKRHIIGGFGFELGKLGVDAVRDRMLGHLALVDDQLVDGVAEKLGVSGRGTKIKPAVEPKDTKPSAPLSQYADAPHSIEGRTIAVLTTPGAPSRLLAAVKKAVEAAGADLAIIAPKKGPFTTSGGKEISPDDFLGGAPSVLFDAVILAPADEDDLVGDHAAIDWVRDAFAHLKVIGFTDAAHALLEKAGIGAEVDRDEGLVLLKSNGIDEFIERAKQHRIWAREERMGG